MNKYSKCQFLISQARLCTTNTSHCRYFLYILGVKQAFIVVSCSISNAEKMWTCTHFLMWISSCYSKVRNGSCLTFIWLEIELLPKKLDSESKSCLSSVKQGRQSRPEELKDEFLYDCNWQIPFLAPIHAGQVAVGQWEFTATPLPG